MQLRIADCELWIVGAGVGLFSGYSISLAQFAIRNPQSAIKGSHVSP